MPSLQKIVVIDVQLERFIENCTAVELQEVILLAHNRLLRINRGKESETVSARDIALATLKEVVANPAEMEAPPDPDAELPPPKKKRRTKKSSVPSVYEHF